MRRRVSLARRVPGGTVDVVLSYCHCSLHDTSLIEVRRRSETTATLALRRVCVCVCVVAVLRRPLVSHSGQR
jgi:hypothetical protein